jgi:hypothetical protein
MSAGSDRLGDLIYEKITKRKNQQDRMYRMEWTLRKIEINNFPNNILDVVIRAIIIDLENRKYKTMKRSDTDEFCIKIENLQWVLFVFFAMRNGDVLYFEARNQNASVSPVCLCR